MTPILAQRLGAERACERLYRRHAGHVYRYALAILHNAADAEDATQTTFLNAYRALQRGERPHKPQSWLTAIAHNVCRQRFRDASRRPREVELDADVAETLAPDESPGAEDIRRALGHLSFNQRAALVMRELEGRSYAEIAGLLGISLSAVETLVFRARRALREQLEGSLTCAEAELALSKQLDGRLARGEAGAVRAHIRECAECATLARRMRAQRTALGRALGAVPLPASLASLLGGGAAAVGTGVAAKAAAVTLVGAVVAGAGYEGVRHSLLRPPAARAVQVRLEHPRAARAVAPAPRVVPPAPPVEPIVRRPARTSPRALVVVHGRHANVAGAVSRRAQTAAFVVKSRPRELHRGWRKRGEESRSRSIGARAAAAERKRRDRVVRDRGRPRREYSHHGRRGYVRATGLDGGERGLGRHRRSRSPQGEGRGRHRDERSAAPARSGGARGHAREKKQR